MSGSEAGAGAITISVPFDLGQVAEVRRWVEAVVRKARIDHERAFNLKVAVSEACANAIEHSKGIDGQVDVRATVTRGYLIMEVSSPGDFRVPLSTNSSHRQHRGMGLPLMVALTDEVRIRRRPGGGTMVTLAIQVGHPGSRNGRPFR